MRVKNASLSVYVQFPHPEFDSLPDCLQNAVRNLAIKSRCLASGRKFQFLPCDWSVLADLLYSWPRPKQPEFSRN